MQTKQKGDLALASAIQYFVSQDYEVCLPIGDKRDYDLIIEKGGQLSRVQVKYAGLYLRGNQCKVGLRITGGNQSFHYAKKYMDDAFDELFVYTAKGEMFLLPWSKVTARNEISIEHKKYEVFRLRGGSEAVKHV
ncbi:MAG TPA: group I intron-associated PD-(D/E)XK endonuclease [Candidatus Saccharimonadales bacterium]|nr:group I intron-associated PD-(D/E)XK endonuclease [Candidatus Saccharimonadales bacterium]